MADTEEKRPAESAAESRNFIEQEIDRDLREGRYHEVKTRFPPEPNGYLHIGHAKSILLNYGIAEKYGGSFNLRFDDTNPTKEKTEFVDSIRRDVEWLGADFGDRLFFASDYFDIMYEKALLLIRKGKAFVDELSAEEISTIPAARAPSGTARRRRASASLRRCGTEVSGTGSARSAQGSIWRAPISI